MQSFPGNPKALARFAERLADDLDHVLERWQTEVAAGEEEKIVATLTRQEFYDKIPAFLTQFCANLAGQHESFKGAARQHGAHRWQQGLTVAEVAREWKCLHHVLLERVDSLLPAEELGVDGLKYIYRSLSEAIEDALTASMSDYHSRLRAQAGARVHELERMLEQHEVMDQRRGQGLRQASHDLRGSMQPILSLCYLLKKQSLTREARNIVEQLAGASENLQLLFSELLELARLEARCEQLDISDFDAGELLQEITDTMQATAQAKGLALQGRGESDLWVRSDAAKLRRIAQKLLHNALAYTPSGTVTVGWYRDSTIRWCFYVQDAGPGLTPSQDQPLAANLAEASRGGVTAYSEDGKTADSARTSMEGEGIGLAIAYQLCGLLEAVLDVEASPRNDTTFRVYAPFTLKTSQTAAATPAGKA